jgi:hypothetical protein
VCALGPQHLQDVGQHARRVADDGQVRADILVHLTGVEVDPHDGAAAGSPRRKLPAPDVRVADLRAHDEQDISLVRSPVGRGEAGVVDNGGYAEIRERMVDRGIEPQAVDLYRPDFPALARAIGAHGVEAASADELGPLAAEALSADRPTVIYHKV